MQMSDLHLGTGEVAVGVWVIGDACTGVHIAPECDIRPCIAYITEPLGQCHTPASLMPAVLGAMCSTAEMGPLQLVDRMLYRNPANPLLCGIRLPL